VELDEVIQKLDDEIEYYQDIIKETSLWDKKRDIDIAIVDELELLKEYFLDKWI